MIVRTLIITGVLCAGLVVCQRAHSQQPSNNVPCRYVPNGSNVTIQCANGYWQTTTPDGEVYSGNGTFDPNEAAVGSNIVINPATGGPQTGAGPSVTPPTQNLPLLAPYQGEAYGFTPPIK